jgi:hypothetical protein
MHYNVACLVRHRCTPTTPNAGWRLVVVDRPGQVAIYENLRGASLVELGQPENVRLEIGVLIHSRTQGSDEPLNVCRWALFRGEAHRVA